MLSFLLKATRINKLHNRKEKLVVKRAPLSVLNDVGSDL